MMKSIMGATSLLVAWVIFGSLTIQDGKCGQKIMKAEGPPPYNCGEPPSHQTCSNINCHAGPIDNTGNAAVSLNLGGAENGYLPGQTYTFTVSIQKSGLVRSGFQLIVLSNQNPEKSAGKLQLTTPNTTQLVDSTNDHVLPGSNRVWIEQTYTGSLSAQADQNSWSFNWQAPINETEGVSIYLAVLEGDNSGDETGDYTYTKKISLNPITGMELIESNVSKAWYNKDLLQIQLSKTEQKIQLYSETGQLIKTFYNVQYISMIDQHPGCYFLRLNERNNLQKIFIN